MQNDSVRSKPSGSERVYRYPLVGATSVWTRQAESSVILATIPATENPEFEPLAANELLISALESFGLQQLAKRIGWGDDFPVCLDIGSKPGTLTKNKKTFLT